MVILIIGSREVYICTPDLVASFGLLDQDEKQHLSTSQSKTLYVMGLVEPSCAWSTLSVIT